MNTEKKKNKWPAFWNRSRKRNGESGCEIPGTLKAGSGQPGGIPVKAVQTGSRDPFRFYGGGFSPTPDPGERRLYKALRDQIPIIDAAIGKIIRLAGGFQVTCKDPEEQRLISQFLCSVPVNGAQQGIQSFLDSYLEQLLLYGTAVGEIVLDPEGHIGALYNASLDDVELRQESPLEMKIFTRENGEAKPLPWPELVFSTALCPEPGTPWGVSILRSLPFVTEILLKIYRSIGINWERVGDVRFAVTYKPGNDGDRAFARERAAQIAGEWRKAMQNEAPSDFVAVGDVSIQTIGADGKILDSEVPVRQMLEQIVAKLGLPPFLLGLSWSSTERMSSQQADILTSELEFYRRLLEPAIRKICGLWFRLEGKAQDYEILWDEITLQDETENANARWLNARALQLEQTLKKGEEGKA